MIPKNTLELLEFHKVLRLVADFANSKSSKDSILDIAPVESREDIETRLNLIDDIRRLCDNGTPLNLYQFSDISGHIIRIRPEGAFLEAIELADFIPFLDIAHKAGEMIRGRSDIPALKEYASFLTGFPDLLKTLRKSIDEEGNILDSASFHLANIRSQKRKLEIRIRKKLEEITRDEKLSLFLQDDFITTKSGRWVIPVRMDSKGMVPGVVHDISKSGETAFIEPLGIINLSNELENLISDQKAEELRILRTICSMIRTVIDGIEEEFRAVVYIDVLNSVARLADKLSMTRPSINETMGIQLDGARHPLLELSLNKSDMTRKIVPLDARLGDGHTVMVITGANAGGKTIAIKTIGLIVLMALSGMPVPASSSTSVPFITNLHADIGDEQSIENNLSTFSAHMSNISKILMNKDPDTVVLIDELGTGTDPDEGAALGCSILKHIRESGCLVFATTHLSDIKSFVHRTEGMLNASMEFDQNTFTPLYRLRVGEPGQSHALDIARKYGIPENVIADARHLLGRMKAEMDIMITDLNMKRIEYEKSLQDIEQQWKNIEKRNQVITGLLSEAEEKRRKILSDAYREATGIVDNTKRQMNIFLDEVKKKEKDERRKTIMNLKQSREIITEKLMELGHKEMPIPSLDEIKPGDLVFIRSLGQTALVAGINKKNGRLKVSAGNIDIEVPLSDITHAEQISTAAHEFHRKPISAHEPVPPKLTLAGKRVDEALSLLERFLNDASLSDIPEVVIVHGIGRGFLSKAIHNHLNGHPLITNYRSGNYQEGGAGVTIAVMK